MFDIEFTEQCTRQLLAELNHHPHRDLFLPHGFEVERVVAEQVPNMFSPALTDGQRITINISVPTIYSAKTGPRGLRADLPAERENLDVLRRAITSGLRAHGVRADLHGWEVTPDEAPPPYLPDGTPNGPPANWSVTAVLEAH
jgi:hypothetical protein